MDVVIGLGSNLGDRRQTLVSAIFAIRSFVSSTVVSALYETDAFGPPQPDFLNAAVRGEYPRDPPGLLGRLLELERRHGRERRERWGPRTLDLDILWISGLEVSLPDLTVPHPRLRERRFALAPLLDCAPEATDPRGGEALRNWLEKLPMEGVRRIAGPDWVP